MLSFKGVNVGSMIEKFIQQYSIIIFMYHI